MKKAVRISVIKNPFMYIVGIKTIVYYWVCSLLVSWVLMNSVGPSKIPPMQALSWLSLCVSVVLATWWVADQYKKRSRLPKGIRASWTWGSLMNAMCFGLIFSPPFMIEHAARSGVCRAVSAEDFLHEIGSLGMLDKDVYLKHAHITSEKEADRLKLGARADFGKSSHFHVDARVDSDWMKVERMCDADKSPTSDRMRIYMKYGLDLESVAEDISVVCAWAETQERSEGRMPWLTTIADAGVHGVPQKVVDAAGRLVPVYRAFDSRLRMIAASHNVPLSAVYEYGEKLSIRGFAHRLVFVDHNLIAAAVFLVVVGGVAMAFAHALRPGEYLGVVLVVLLVHLVFVGGNDALADALNGFGRAQSLISLILAGAFLACVFKLWRDSTALRMTALGRMAALGAFVIPLCYLSLGHMLKWFTFSVPHFHSFGDVPLWKFRGATIYVVVLLLVLAMTATPWLADRIRGTPADV